MSRKVPRRSHMRKTSSGKIVPVRKHMMKVNNSHMNNKNFNNNNKKLLEEYKNLSVKLANMDNKEERMNLTEKEYDKVSELATKKFRKWLGRERTAFEISVERYKEEIDMFVDKSFSELFPKKYNFAKKHRELGNKHFKLWKKLDEKGLVDEKGKILEVNK